MQDQNLVDQLISAYHTLNTTVRMEPEARLHAQASAGTSIEDIVRRMRDDELRFSQALKERLTGVPLPDMLGEDAAPVIGTEGVKESGPILISQFGSAREVTLSLLRNLPESVWDETAEGGKSIRMRVTELVANNQRQLARIASQLGGAAPA